MKGVVIHLHLSLVSSFSVEAKNIKVVLGHVPRQLVSFAGRRDRDHLPLLVFGCRFDKENDACVGYVVADIRYVIKAGCLFEAKDVCLSGKGKGREQPGGIVIVSSRHFHKHSASTRALERQKNNWGRTGPGNWFSDLKTYVIQRRSGRGRLPLLGSFGLRVQRQASPGS
jgi:hypothetical protein